MTIDENKVRAVAHSIWMEEGCPEGKGDEHWERAMRIVAAEKKPMKTVAKKAASAVMKAKTAVKKVATKKPAAKPAAKKTAAKRPAPKKKA